MLNPRDKQRERAIQQALQLRIARRYERQIAGYIGTAMTNAARLLPDPMAVDMAVAGQSVGLTVTMEQMQRQAAILGGQRLLAETKSLKAVNVRKFRDFQEELRLRTENYVRTWTGSKVTQIDSTTRTQIQKIITAGEQEGLSTAQIAELIQRQAPQISILRSHLIARTETHGLNNFGATEAAGLSELELEKEWVAALDDRTRDDEFNHVEADGQRVKMAEMFTVSGEELEYPGDVRGSAGNIIYCRCAVVFVTTD